MSFNRTPPLSRRSTSSLPQHPSTLLPFPSHLTCVLFHTAHHGNFLIASDPNRQTRLRLTTQFIQSVGCRDIRYRLIMVPRFRLSSSISLDPSDMFYGGLGVVLRTSGRYLFIFATLTYDGLLEQSPHFHLNREDTDTLLADTLVR